MNFESTYTSFEVVRNGVYLEERKINEKAFYLVGKLPDLCDIVLEHESISRKHAIIQHSRQGDVFLYDLGNLAFKSGGSYQFHLFRKHSWDYSQQEKDC